MAAGNLAGGLFSETVWPLRNHPETAAPVDECHGNAHVTKYTAVTIENGFVGLNAIGLFLRCEFMFFIVSGVRSYLANTVKALALAELIFDLPCTLFGLFKAAHSIRLLIITEVDVAQV